tara:strand:- start:3255 stop:3530 length:276 start_codon:yes stop_codon:yes gene_type:complete
MTNLQENVKCPNCQSVLTPKGRCPNHFGRCGAKQEIKHPDLDWARAEYKRRKGDSITDTDLATLRYAFPGVYFVDWQGMTLGMEHDGYIHS